MRLGVIVLNYLAYQTTVECVRSFLRQQCSDVDLKIVIVDNNSANESFSVLYRTFQDQANVRVVKSNSNLGFANGNNLGYATLKQWEDCDFVICSNSDIILNKLGLSDWVVSNYTKYEFAVLGPSVYSVASDAFQSPIPSMSNDVKLLKKQRNSMKVSLFKTWLKKRLPLLGVKRRIIVKMGNQEYDELQLGCTIHGSFQVFSKKYLSCYSDLYDQGTFLYLEENILKYRCDIRHLCMMYDPSYQVDHLESVSTRLTQDREKQVDKAIIKQRRMLKSFDRLIKLHERGCDLDAN